MEARSSPRCLAEFQVSSFTFQVQGYRRCGLSRWYNAPLDNRRGFSMRFTIRDLLWLLVVAALAMGWWIDQDRIRRQEEKLRGEAQRIHTLPLTRAEAVLQVVEAELAANVEVNQRNPGAVSESDFRRLQMQLDVAKLDVEMARAKEKFGSATNPLPKGQNSK
jgi:hypothetical protein